MARKLASDKVLFITLVVLSLFGCVMIYSASAVSAGEMSGNPYRYLVKQIVALVLGGIAAFAVYRTDYRQFSKPWVVYGAYAISLSLAVFALFRPPINGARRWIPLGVTMLQPAELLKVALVLLLAHQLARKTEKAGDAERALLPAVVFSGLAAGVVVLQPDLGTAACYVMLCAVLLWLAGAASIASCGTMAEAVAHAARLARPGDTVLLSPACASFDQYRNFEERGRHFADLAHKAAGERHGP